MHGDEIGVAIDGLGALGALQAELVEPLGRHERVVGQHPHAQAASILGYQEADAAEAEHTEGLATQLYAALAPLALLPAAGLEVGVSLRDVARARHDESDGGSRRREHIALRRVDDDDAALGGFFDVDVVDAYSCTSHDAQLDAGLNDLGGHLGGRANDQAVVIGDTLQQLVGIPRRAVVHAETLGFEVGDALEGELLFDQHLHVFSHVRASHHSSTALVRNTCSAAARLAPNFTSKPS